MRRGGPPRASWVAALAACLLLAVPAAAGDADEAASRTQRLLAALPPPGEAATGFEFACYLLRAGAPYARARFSAWPTARSEAQGDGGWQLRDEITPLRGGADRVTVQAHANRRLEVLRGTYDRRNADGFLKATWARTPQGTYDIRHLSDDYDNRLEVRAPPALGTLAGLLLFLRIVPPGPAVYEVPDFDPNPGAGDGFVETARVEVHRQAPWRVGAGVRDAWIVSYTRGTQTLRLALDATTRDFLGLTFLGRPLMFVPQGHGTVGLLDPQQPGVATPLERAWVRTRALRDALPVPQEPLAWEGDLRNGGAIVGTVRVEAQPASFGGRAAWRVLESSALRTGASEVTHEIHGFLGRDLRVLRGEESVRRPEGRGRSTYVRKPGGLETVRAADGTAQPAVLLAAAEDAIAGTVPVLLFLRHVPRQSARYVLPGFDPRRAQPPKAGTGSFPASAGDVYVTVQTNASYVAPGQAARPSLRARCALQTGVTFDVHVDPEDRRLLGVVGVFPRLDWTPPGLPAAPLDWYDAVEGVPTSARQVFVKFGRGYHRPRPDLLADAFYWPSMREQAVAQGRYAKDTPLETIRRDWIDVFVGMSKHRTAADCDDLLFQIFMTSREVEHADGSVSIATRPVYGGHVYRCRRIGERWAIVAIDP